MPRAAHQLEEHQLHEPETVTTDPNPTESQGAEVPALPPSDPSFYERLGPAGRTVVEAMAIAAINMVLALVLQSLHLQLFLAAPENVHSIELLRKINPAVLFVLAVAIAPVLEESLFRGLPFLIMRGLSRWGEMQDITRQVGRMRRRSIRLRSRQQRRKLSSAITTISIRPLVMACY